MEVHNATNLNRKSGGAQPSGYCGAPFVGPAPTGLQPSHPPNPPGNINLPFVIPGFQEYSVEPQIRSAALKGCDFFGALCRINEFVAALRM